MTTIDRLSALDELATGDSLVLYSSANSDARRATLTTLLEFLQTQLDDGGLSAPGSSFASQYRTPVTGFNITVASPASDADGSENVHLILTPAGTLATGTVTLPAVADCIDKQEVLVTSTQIVTTLTVAGNGAAATPGAPTTIAANGFFRMKFDAVTTNWYRVG